MVDQRPLLKRPRSARKRPQAFAKRFAKRSRSVRVCRARVAPLWEKRKTADAHDAFGGRHPRPADAHDAFQSLTSKLRGNSIGRVRVGGLAEGRGGEGRGRARVCEGRGRARVSRCRARV